MAAGLDRGRSIHCDFPRSANREPARRRPDATACRDDRQGPASIPAPAATRTPDPRTAFVLSGGGNQARQPGRDAAGPARARRSSPTWSSDLGRRLQRGGRRDRRRASPASSTSGRRLDVAPHGRGVPRRHLAPGVELPRAATTTSSATRGCASILDRAQRRRRSPRLAVPLRVVADRPETGDEVVFARGPLRAARCSRARRSRASSHRSSTTGDCSSTARSSTPCRCRTRWPARSTGST